MKKLLFTLLLCLMALPALLAKQPERTIVTLRTNYGTIRLWLYDETPLHRDNFVKMCEDGTVKGLLFHRVIKDFLIQAGDLRKDEQGNVKPLYEREESIPLVPAEILPQFFCAKGALIDAKQGDDTNPLRSSAGSHFCIVQGRKMTDAELDRTEARMNETQRNYLYHRTRYDLKQSNPSLADAELNALARQQADQQYQEQGAVRIPEEHRAVYRKEGGTPHLDGTVTIFGKLLSGQKVVEKITLMQTDAADRPVEDVEILSVKVQRK